MVPGERKTKAARLQDFPSTVFLMPAHSKEAEISRALTSL